MKTNQEKMVLTFGDFIAGAYRAWGWRRAKGLVSLAIRAGWVGLLERQRVAITKD